MEKIWKLWLVLKKITKCPEKKNANLLSEDFVPFLFSRFQFPILRTGESRGVVRRKRDFFFDGELLVLSLIPG